ncbi:MAG: flavoprotein [Kiritimatiellae bacterium]|nr:flavoprotein [Kiritimatiellia bacterium]
MKTVVLGVTGSIAAYKACELTRMLIKSNAIDVHVIMTAAAAEFVTPLTFRTLSRNPVAINMFDDPEDWIPEHISLAEKADLLVIAPCTANVIAKIAHGFSDDMLCSTVLATRAPLLIAPAMNSGMFDNPATQANIALLKTRKAHFVEPKSGDLACGTIGQGRMAPPEDIYERILEVLKPSGAHSKAGNES